MNNTFGEENSRITACWAIHGYGIADNKVRLVAQEDPDGSMAGVPGFYIQNHEAITNFIDESSCQTEIGCLRFCPGICLRLGVVGISQAKTTRGYNMVITDTGSSMGMGIDRGKIWFDEIDNYMDAPMPFQLPAPVGKYQISFTDKNGDPAWPGYANINLEKPPACSDALDESQIELAMPPSDDIRCGDLFREDNYPEGIHGWQTFFAGIEVRFYTAPKEHFESPTTTPTASPIESCITDASCDYLATSACTQGETRFDICSCIFG